jgi:hypothetical protein
MGLAAAAVVLLTLSMALGCGRAGRPPAPGEKGNEAKASAPQKTPGLPEEAPVTVEFLGLSADKEHARYRLHVNTARPVAQVDVGLVYTDADGKEQRATYVWQNVVESKRQLIEKGKAYQDEAYVGRGATGVVCRVLHVVYKDGAPETLLK